MGGFVTYSSAITKMYFVCSFYHWKLKVRRLLRQCEIIPPNISFVMDTKLHSHLVSMYLNQNSQAVIKVCGPQKGYGEKRCEIQGGGQEMAVMVG